jgi:hypothetical protein
MTKLTAAFRYYATAPKKDNFCVTLGMCIHMQALSDLIQVVTPLPCTQKYAFRVSDGKSAVLHEVLRGFLPSLQDSASIWATVAYTDALGQQSASFLLSDLLRIVLQKLVIFYCVLWIHSYTSNRYSSVSIVTRLQAGRPRNRG